MPLLLLSTLLTSTVAAGPFERQIAAWYSLDGELPLDPGLVEDSQSLTRQAWRQGRLAPKAFLTPSGQGRCGLNDEQLASLSGAVEDVAAIEAMYAHTAKDPMNANAQMAGEVRLEAVDGGVVGACPDDPEAWLSATARSADGGWWASYTLLTATRYVAADIEQDTVSRHTTWLHHPAGVTGRGFDQVLYGHTESDSQSRGSSRARASRSWVLNKHLGLSFTLTEPVHHPELGTLDSVGTVTYLKAPAAYVDTTLEWKQGEGVLRHQHWRGHRLSREWWTDAAGQKHGPDTAYHPNGSVMYDQCWVSGEKAALSPCPKP